MTVEAAPAAARISPPWRRNRLPLLLVTLLIAVTAAPAFVVSVHAEKSGAAWTAAALVVWLLYGLPLLWVVLRLDFFQPQTMIGIAGALAWGALIATGLVFSLNADLRALIGALFGQSFQQTWASVIAAPLTEEIAKGTGVFVVLLLAAQRPHTPLDGLIIGAAVGLGFQVAENLVYTLRAMPLLGDLPAIWAVLRVRGFLGGLWSHALYTAIVGYGIGYAVVRRGRRMGKRLLMVLGCLLAGAGLHALWNSPLLEDPRNAGPGQFVKGVIALVFFGAILVAGQRRESAVFLPYLADPELGRGLASAAEQADLRDSGARLGARMRAAGLVARSREAVRGATSRRGSMWQKLGDRWTAAQQQGRLQRAQADAAVALAFGLAGHFTLARGQIHGARTQLRRVCGAQGSALPPSAAAEPGAGSTRATVRLPRLEQGRAVAMLAMVLAVFGVLDMLVALLSVGLALLALRITRGSAVARVRARNAMLAALGSLLVSLVGALWALVVK